MKKNFAFLFVPMLALLLGGCNNSEPEPTPLTYKVTYETSTDYSLTGLKESYLEKEMVSFQVSVTNSKKEIQSVKEDDTILTLASDAYTFEMPAHDVTLSIILQDKEPHFSFSQIEYELEPGVDRSEIKGAPWINTNLPNQVDKIKKPSLKDDFYTSVNYEGLKANQNGYLNGGSDVVSDIFYDIFDGTSSADNTHLFHNLYNGLTNGATTEIHSYFSSFDYDTYSTTKALFNDEHSFFTIEVQGSYSYLYFNDGYFYGATGMSVINHEAQNYPSVKTVRNGIVSELNTAFNLGFTNSDLTAIYTFDYDTVDEAMNTLNNWSKYNYGDSWLDDALIDYGFTTSMTRLYISEATKAVLNMWSNYSSQIIKNALILRLAYQYRYLSGLEHFKNISSYTGRLNWLDDSDYSGYSDFTVKTEIIKKLMPMALEKAYLDIAGNSSTKTKIAQVIEQVINGYKATADTYDWLDDETKAGLLRKLNNMAYYSCYSDKIKNYPIIDETNIDTISLLTMCNRYKAWKENLIKSSLVETNLLLTYMPSYTVNAFYTPGYNSFVILNGVLGAMPINGSIEEVLGSIGVVIGHEISHSIDENGSQYDEYGNRNNWWSSSCRSAFESKVTKMKKFYNQITLFDSTKVNGTKVNTEATADMGGLHICLEIAKSYDNFDYDLFFKTYAKVWLRTPYNDYAVSVMLEDEHPFPYLRVNVTVAQFDEFYETYDIGPDNRMYIPPKERVTIW